jgi:hypothetical protein
MDGYALSSVQCSTRSAEQLARSHPNFPRSASVQCIRVLRLAAGALAGRSDHLERFTPGGGG